MGDHGTARMKLARVTKFLPDWGRYWNQIPFRARLVLLGFALTAIVLVMEGIGALSPLENWLYDIRARNCQFFAKAPTTQLVHLDIDDAALDTVGRWPWDRRVIAAGGRGGQRAGGQGAGAGDPIVGG